MLVIGKDDKKTYEVFDVSYDHNGYPKFLVFKGNQWMRLSAKHFIPQCYDVIEQFNAIGSVNLLSPEKLRKLL